MNNSFHSVLHSFVKIYSSAILSEIKGREEELQNSQFLKDLSVRLEWAGITDVHNKIYIQPTNINNLSFLIFLLTVPQLHKLYLDRNTGMVTLLYIKLTRIFRGPVCDSLRSLTASLLSKKLQDPIDAYILALGIQSVLKQFGAAQLHGYVTHVSEYVVSFVMSDR